MTNLLDILFFVVDIALYHILVLGAGDASESTTEATEPVVRSNLSPYPPAGSRRGWRRLIYKKCTLYYMPSGRDLGLYAGAGGVNS